MRKETILQAATFDSKLPKYWMANALIVMAVSVVFIPLIPVWMIFGWNLHRKQYERLECHLTDRSLNIRKGLIFRVEKNIPLDKIQDVGLREGPLLRWLGLASLVIETAGQSGPQGGADAHLVGVVEAPRFRDAVLDQRDEVVAGLRGGSSVPKSVFAPDSSNEAALLREIRDCLQRIEGKLERGA
ncbi:MAG: PH domain-containing protein [Planctomycetes bacterium]|nr:PH domain-containing protein [Planctomycetota bacterium]